MTDLDALRVLEADAWNEHVARRAACRAGAEAARAARPAASIAEARQLLAETREALALAALGALPRLRVLEDGLDLLEQARGRGTPLLARELGVLFRFLRAARDLRRELIALAGRPALRSIGAAMPDIAPFVCELELAVDERGLLLDSASERLCGLRLEIAELKERVRREIERFASRQEVRPFLRSGHPSLRDGR
ncbi:MAG: hypothetical protein HY812_02070, partial [Planctomycetes bacterium]|nr:hypothetical protein [Planctomycetota bacterium]